MNGDKTKILFFIGSLQCGGKERRLVELIGYLKSHSNMEFMMVVTRDKVHYKSFFDLDVPYHVIPKSRENYDTSVFGKFYRICKDFNPDIIHTWGRIQTFYALPAALRLKKPICNSQITIGERPKESFFLKLIDRVNYRFSDVVLTNSFAGVRAFGPPQKKTKVIYNGMNLDRFQNLPPLPAVKCRHDIKTKYAVIMAASFNGAKDYERFYRVARLVTQKHEDVTFIGVGGFDKKIDYYLKIKGLSKDNERILFPGKVDDVEALVNACTIGVLFSGFEGISNAILEYMALGKPVIASNCGGNNELVKDNWNGYLIGSESDEEVADRILGFLNDPEKCQAFGRRSKRKIFESFRNDTMGEAFKQVYASLTTPHAPRAVAAPVLRYVETK